MVSKRFMAMATVAAGMIAGWGMMRGDAAEVASSQGAETMFAWQTSYQFRGTVAKIVMLQEYQGTAIVMGVDAHYVVVISGVKAVSGKLPVEEGKEMAIVIHSPALLFAKPQEEVVGKECAFDVMETKIGRQVRVSKEK